MGEEHSGPSKKLGKGSKQVKGVVCEQESDTDVFAVLYLGNSLLGGGGGHSSADVPRKLGKGTSK